jgi:transcriptional regulator with PAS, ATPase and Fis domain
MFAEDSESTEFHENESLLRLRAVELSVKSGPDAGRSARIERPSFVIGTGEAADLRLSDPTVSREHIRLALTEHGIHLRDDGSRNGTWLGGVRIADVTITSDTVIDLGATRLALRIESDPLDLPISESIVFGKALGVSASMRHLFAVLERASSSDVTVLLEGESGVGKEVLARAVHDKSTRANGPFVAADCSSFPAGLIEAELFGHEKGAYTGAEEARRGVFAQANGGTLFLDEIGELPLDLQPKLLRVLEQRQVKPLGSGSAQSIDVRVIAATNRCLAEAAHKGEFRRDLFYRLAVARVIVPPLRDRLEDVEPLAREFLCAALGDPDAELPQDLGALLRSYRWPGNVRELRNVIDRYALLGVRDVGNLFDVALTDPDKRFADELARLPYHEARRRALDAFERSYLPKVLKLMGGVVVRAAEHAQVTRASFYRMLERAGISPKGHEDRTRHSSPRTAPKDRAQRTAQ